MLKQYNLFIVGFFVLFFFAGLTISKDFGMSWDEGARRQAGLPYAKYLIEIFNLDIPKSKSISDYNNSYYAYHEPFGMLFELPAILIEEILDIKDKGKIVFMRHKLNFTFYFFGVLFFFLFTRVVFKSNSMAFIATLIYICHPRLFAHGFYNSKDAIFQSCCAITLFPIAMLYSKRTITWLLLSGVSLGICASFRIVGIYLPVLLTIFILILNQKTSIYWNIKKITISCIIIVFSSLLSIYVFTPFYWEDPINRFMEQLFLNKSFYLWNGNNFLFGDLVPASDLPWYYILVWIGITTPISILLIFLLGVILIFYRIIHQNWSIETNFGVFSIAAIIVPFSAAIFFNSMLYNGWRHFYFIYPFIAFISSTGFVFLYNWIKYKTNFYSTAILLTLFLLVFSEPVNSMITMHPHQHIYFNFLAGEKPLENFEGDYWGLSFREGLEYIARIDNRDSINVAVINHPGDLNLRLLNKSDKDRLFIIHDSNTNYDDYNNVDYFISNFRRTGSLERENRTYVEGEFPYINNIYYVIVDDMKILGVYDIKKIDLD